MNKSIYIGIIALLIAAHVLLPCREVRGQSPLKMSYQAVIRNSSNQLVTSHAVGMRISILEGSATGTAVYTETITPIPNTNANGLVSIEIGGGAGFEAINWANGLYFIKTETDPTGGTNYTITGTNQLLSVPYALHAKTAENGFSGNYTDLLNKPALVDSTNIVTIIDNQTIVGTKIFNSDLTINGLTVGKGNGAVSTNTSNGYRALFTNTTGGYNTANGYMALYYNTLGDFNTAVGLNALYANTTGSMNTAIGQNALNHSTTGAQNTAIGVQALYTNTTGGWNTANGTSALRNNTTGYANTADGSGALEFNTTGYNNTADGYQALYNNTTGVNNTAIGGWRALFSNTTGVNNTAIGSLALLSNTTGSSNIAIGAYAGYKNTTNRGNIFIGDSAGYNSTAYSNQFIGHCAGLKNTTGAINIAIGYDALHDNTTGYCNTANGVSALRSNTTGYYNTALGHSALEGNRTGTYNTAIGYSTDVSGWDITNATALGYDATVYASNNMVFGNSNVVGWGFGVAPGTAAIKVGSTTSNGNGATLTLSGVWTNASDSTKKFNIQPINYGLKDVMKLRPVSYKMKGTGTQDIGFIAQEVKLILPELVYGKEGDMSLSYGQITAVLTKAMQEQQKTIETQQKQIDEMRKLIESLIKK